MQASPPPGPDPSNPQIGQLSPDGFYVWTEKGWTARGTTPPASGTPTQMRPTPIWLSAGQAFKIGFFGTIGAWVASLIPIIILVFVFGSCAAAISHLGSTSPSP